MGLTASPDGLGPIFRPLPYAARLDQRSHDAITLVVIHCTELPDLATAREYGERLHYPDSHTGNSGHFYVDRDGTVEQWVDLAHVAHHVRGHNADSLGIELVNRGRYPDWFDSRRQEDFETYPEAQIVALLDLLAALRRRLPGLARIAGHEDLDRERVAARDDESLVVARKRDPGPTFPWHRVIADCGLLRWRGNSPGHRDPEA